MMEAVLKNNGQSYNRDNPRGPGLEPMKLALWVSMASISMMFAGFLSAYIVRQAAGNWFEFTLPGLFMVSTAIILISSLTLHGSLKAFRAREERKYKALLVLSFLLGIAFIVTQYEGWMVMRGMGIDLKGNPSGAFVYVISGVHVAHVMAGLAAMVVALIHAFVLDFRVTKYRINRLEITCQYWHYVDVLWIVLYLFLTFYR